MRALIALVLCLGLASCAAGGSPADQARNDHDLSVANNYALLFRSQVATAGQILNDATQKGVGQKAAP